MSKWHEILGVHHNATVDEIMLAYKRARRAAHPDTPGGSIERFGDVQRAYSAITRPTVCPKCQGKGTVTKRAGFFKTKERCPNCWKTELR